MPTPAYQISTVPRGIYDFTTTLTQDGLPTEHFQADKNGMLEIINALANRVRYDDISPVVLATRLNSDVNTLANTWTNIDLSSGISVNQNNWFDGQTFTPTVPGYYRFNIKMNTEETQPEENAAIRLLFNSVTTIAFNTFYNYFSLSPIDTNLYLNRFTPFMNGTTDHIEFQVRTSIAGVVLSGGNNFLEITKI